MPLKCFFIDRLTITREGETTKETTATPGWILLERGRTSWKCDTDQATEGLRSTELLSLKQIIQVMNCVSGLSQNSNMLQLLKMKRTKKIIPQNIAQEDGSVQQFYGVGDLLEAICRLPPVSTFLAQLARKTSKSKEKILINMRGIFRPGCLITIERGDFVVVNGLGRLPLKCQDTLMTFRDSVLQNIEKFLGNFESLTSGDEELTRTFTSPLEGILWLCAILEPEMQVKGLFSVSQEGVQYIGPRTSLASYASRKVSLKFHPTSKVESFGLFLDRGGEGRPRDCLITAALNSELVNLFFSCQTGFSSLSIPLLINRWS